MPECKCERCVDACRKEPGWFLPGEAEKAAALLGMTFEAFRSRYLIREYWADVPDIYVWAPRKVGVDEGLATARWSSGFQEAPCIFLTDQNLCRIHEAKPAECRESMCCGEEILTRKAIKTKWKKIGNPLSVCIGT